ncbi:MAG TPA: YggS family pyridoxal phosphate-dependent enzyme [Dehalococcoidales bacterium]|nr:YggS family pyridoxal phosphate-dependent enzyme [Dehalococcoidales bacterium]
MSLPDIRANVGWLNLRLAAACQRAGRAVSEVTLVAVTKNIEVSAIREAHQAGLRHFGENRVQEGLAKFPQLTNLDPPPVRHLIGHLQSNKIKSALENFDIIHSLDSVELAEKISRRCHQPYPILLEVNIGGESSKSGFAPGSVFEAFKQISCLPNLEIRGLMTVAPVFRNVEDVRPVFRMLRELRDKLGLQELSMGMSDDFEIAIEEGATLVRIGRAIFGERTG